jgi:hypothetical protein
MPIPLQIDDFSESDDYNFVWTVRVNAGLNQLMYDYQSEYQYPNKSQSVRSMLETLFTHFEEILKLNNQELSGNIKTRLDYMAAENEANERDRAIASLHRRLNKIARTTHEPTRIKLLDTAKAYAEMYSLEWPPPSANLIDFDDDAKNVFDAISRAVNRSEEGKTTMRTIGRNTRFEHDELVQILHRLEENNYIKLNEEQRSGAPTIWICLNVF